MFRIYFLIPLLVPLALIKGDFASGIFDPLERWIARVAEKPARAVALTGLFSLLLVMALTLCTRVPAPGVADEFGYLLIGDTLAHGRVTNPTPPLWQHFESIHQIMRPTYAAKYPPGQGLALAVGELLGSPVIGTWLSTALACAAACWMLMAWLPARWAFAGGLMVALHPQVIEWSQNYWGGAVAMTGGMLVLGAFGRILKEQRPANGVWMGLGLGIMANSRPFEGLVFGMLVMVAMLVLLAKDGKFISSLVPVYGPMVAVLAVFAAQICYYDWRVTGNPFLMPYVVHERTYAYAPQFLFEKPWPEPNYHHEQIRRLHEGYMAYYQSQVRSVPALLEAVSSKIEVLAQAYFWSYLMVVALLALPWALARRKILWLLLAMGVIFSIAVTTGTWSFAHYAAPAAGLFFLLVLESMRSLHAWRAGDRRPGRNIVRGLAILFLISYVQIFAKMAAQDSTAWNFQRVALIEKLRNEPGKSLVFVKYGPAHNPNREWVYNEADIPAAKVILARDMGARNKELLDYFPDRKAWVVDADAANPELEPYPGS